MIPPDENPKPDTPQEDDSIFEQNLARMLVESYGSEAPLESFAAGLKSKIHKAREVHAKRPSFRFGLRRILTAAAIVAFAVLIGTLVRMQTKPTPQGPEMVDAGVPKKNPPPVVVTDPHNPKAALPLSESPTIARLEADDEPRTRTCKDGSTVTVAPGSRAVVTEWPTQPRPRIDLLAGKVTCKMEDGPGILRVKTLLGEAVALGARFTVTFENEETPNEQSPHQQGETKLMKRSDLSALLMSVAVAAGQVILSGTDGSSQLAFAGENASVATKGAADVAFRGSQLVPRREDGSLGDPMEVRKHQVKLSIRDQIALVEVDQTFFNPSDQRLEGTFNFPLPNGATICRLAMYVGDNLMEGEIAEAARARRTFEALKVQRIDPALLEWAGGNNFKMRVFPIEPKSEKRVLISYYEVLPVVNDRLRLTYPLASDALQTHPVGRIELNVECHSTPAILASRTPGFEANLSSAPHQVDVKYVAEKARPEKDFVFECTLAPDREELTSLPFWDARNQDGYFLLIFSPKLKDIASEKGVGHRFVFVVDTSGGIGSRHLALAVKSVEAALGKLSENDLFGIVAYDTFSRTFGPALTPCTVANRNAATAWLKDLRPLGAGDLRAAWKATAGLCGGEEAQVVYIGTGLSTLTSTRTGVLLQEARDALGQARIRLHCMPVGAIQDMNFMAELARQFSGTLRPVQDAEDIEPNVSELILDYGVPLYTGVKLAIEGVEVAEVYPRELPNVAAGRQLFVYGRYLGQGKAKISLSAHTDGDPYQKSFEVSLDSEAENVCVPPLWATRKIEHLQNEAAFATTEAAQRFVQTVVETSKRYTVMSQYTSFLVLESPEDYLRYGIERRVREFGPYAGQGDLSVEAQAALSGRLKELEYGSKPGRNGRMAQGAGGGADKILLDKSDGSPMAETLAKNSRKEALAPQAPAASVRQEQAKTDQIIDPTQAGEKEQARKAAARPDFKQNSSMESKRDSKELRSRAIDGLAWQRQDIFPRMSDPATDPQSNWPGQWRHSSAETLDMLRKLSDRIKSLSCHVTRFRIDASGKELPHGKARLIQFDAVNGRYADYSAGADSKDVCDGKSVVRYFPQLKYAARRDPSPHELPQLASELPGYLVPWAEGIDRQGEVSVEREDADGLILRVADRHNKWTYNLIFMEGRAGPVTRIESYSEQREGQHGYAALRSIVECLEFKEIGGVRLATAFKVIHVQAQSIAKWDDEKLAAERKSIEERMEKLAAGGRSVERDWLRKRLEALDGKRLLDKRSDEVIRLTEVEVNYDPQAEAFSTEVPKDWATRYMKARPKDGDKHPVSNPIDPSLRDWGRR